MTTPDTRPPTSRGQQRILIFIDAYLPGWRAGGPTRSIANLVDILGDTHDLYVFTRDHDHPDSQPYQGVTANRWLRVGKSHVYYASERSVTMATIKRVVDDLDPDLVYLNGVLSRLTMKYLAIRRVHRVNVPILLAPRGTFSRSALSLKSKRKRAYLTVAQATGLFRGIRWQASSTHEAEDIRRGLNSDPVLHIVGNPAAKPLPAPLPSPPKSAGNVSFVSIARLSRMKNLPFLLDVVRQLDGDVTLRLVGRRDANYWPTLEEELEAMPNDIHVSWQGGVPPSQVEEILAGNHFFTLPTLGENFGHAIYEALRVGRPVVISDRTPWRDLEEVKAGWDIQIEAAELWRSVLQGCVDMDQKTYLAMSRAAHALACHWFAASDATEAYAAMFKETIRGASETDRTADPRR